METTTASKYHRVARLTKPGRLRPRRRARQRHRSGCRPRRYGPASWTEAQCDEHDAKRQARLDANRIKRETAKAEAAQYADQDSFVADLARQLNANGTLSERQIEVLLGKPAQIKQRAKAAADQAAKDAAALPVPNGTEVVTGEVLTTKWKDSQWGGSLKMLVLDDRGFKVWGTVPRAIDVEQGVRVRFTASLEQSDDDRLFGFFSKPRKAEVL